MKWKTTKHAKQNKAVAAAVANVNKCQWMFLWDITKFSIFIQKWMNRKIVRVASADEEQEGEGAGVQGEQIMEKDDVKAIMGRE